MGSVWQRRNSTQLDNASTEWPQAKMGGIGLARRTYGLHYGQQLINKSGAFFVRPPLQKTTCAVRRLARRKAPIFVQHALAKSPTSGVVYEDSKKLDRLTHARLLCPHN